MHDAIKLSRRALCAFGLTLPARLWAQLVPNPIGTVVIGPLGPFPPALVTDIEAGLRAELGVHVLTLAPLPLPPAALEPGTRRYRASGLLDDLRSHLVPPSTRILGVTDAEITVARAGCGWGRLGLGDHADVASVASHFKCRTLARGVAQARARLIAACIHEVGHSLGLAHCPDGGCVMSDVRGSAQAVDRIAGHLCARCRARLGHTAHAS